MQSDMIHLDNVQIENVGVLIDVEAFEIVEAASRDAAEPWDVLRCS